MTSSFPLRASATAPTWDLRNGILNLITGDMLEGYSQPR